MQRNATSITNCFGIKDDEFCIAFGDTDFSKASMGFHTLCTCPLNQNLGLFLMYLVAHDMLRNFAASIFQLINKT